MIKSYFFPVIIAFILLVTGYSTFTANVERIKQSTKSNVAVRFDLLNQYMRLLSANNTAMRQSIVDSYAAVIDGRYKNETLLNSISYFNALELYGLSAQQHPKIVAQLEGTLTIAGNLDLLEPSLRNEISAIMMNENQFTVTDLMVRAYYTSTKGVLYLSPKLAMDRLQFFPDLYNQQVYKEVVPSPESSGRQVISSLYEDPMGQGLMITISTPVIIDGQFFGAVSADIGIEYISFILNVPSAIGQSFVIDEKKQLVAANNRISLSATLPMLDNKVQWLDVGDGLLYTAPIHTDELYLVHTLKNSELWTQAAKSSAFIWLLLLFASVLSFIFIFIYKTAARNKELMLLDPLTKLYNRRGFYTLLKPIYSGLLRTSNSFAILMIDIDYFKKFNDRHGHGAGDAVIASIAKTISRTNRKSSICCRWGGGAFMVFCLQASPETAKILAKRINQAVDQQKHGSKKLDITVSVGVCVSRATDDLDTIVALAKQALYHAKEGGRNQVYLHNSLQ